MPPSFKRIGLEDIHLLRNVADEVFDHAIDFGFAQHFLTDPRNILIVALDGGRVVAQIVAIVHQHVDAPPDLFIENLGVAPEWQRRGIARRLIALAFTAGAAQGASAAWVATEEDNDRAAALYRSMGASGDRVLMFSFRTMPRSLDDSEPS